MAARLAGLLALGLVLAAGCGGEQALEGVDAGSRETAPGFELADLAGGRVRLEELRGVPVVLDFWATWCAPCVHQVPVLNDFQAAHPDEVVVLGISVDTDGRQVVADFAEEHGIAYRVLLGSPDLAQRYGAFGFPSLYVVAPDGTIESAHVGVVSRDDLEAALERVRRLSPAS